MKLTDFFTKNKKTSGRKYTRAKSETFTQTLRTHLRQNERGFNLFSALVAALFIMAGVVLVNTLISTEDRMDNSIYAMFTNYHLEDAANIARSDALQSFNYWFRRRMEEYLAQTICTENCVSFPVLQINAVDGTTNYNNNMLDNDIDMKKITTSFKDQVLLSGGVSGTEWDKVIEYVADKTVKNVKTSNYGRYKVEIDTPDDSTMVKQALKEAINSAGEDLLEVVDCDATACDNGSFYLNLPLNKISNTTYEKLPRIIVTDLVTNEGIQIPILPKSNLRIYFPNRFFKAVWMAHKHAIDIASLSTPTGLDSLRGGFCDPNSCKPRDDPKTPTSGSWNKSCPIISGVAAADTRVDMPTGSNLFNINFKFYDASSSSATTTPVREEAAYLLCNTITATANSYPDFVNTALTTTTPKSVFGDHSDIPIIPFLHCPYEQIIVFSAAHPSKTVASYPDRPLYCSKVDGVEADVWYTEKDPNYIVNGGDKIYRIAIKTSFKTGADLYPTPQGVCSSTGTGTSGSCSPIS